MTDSLRPCRTRGSVKPIRGRDRQYSVRHLILPLDPATGDIGVSFFSCEAAAQVGPGQLTVEVSISH